MAENPAKLAGMFLYRELFRRPRVQNNAETMGLVRLTFPLMEAKARADIPRVLREQRVNVEEWAGLAQAAVDTVFRDALAINIPDEWMVRWVSPRWGRLQAIARPGLAPADRPAGTRSWPGPKVNPANPSRLLLLVYHLICGSPESSIDQDRAREALDALWTLITSTAAVDFGRGAWRLDFSKAAVTRVERGWLCPVTRRVLGYTTGGPSPYGPADGRLLTPIEFPRPPRVNPGGLEAEDREAISQWCTTDPSIAVLRAKGLWTDLHDRIAIYPAFLRAQEHSAQIERPLLQSYEERFKAGEINLLNCSTTMEMGVDVPNVSLVANANVPPSVSNYRQRVGRAGRRGEPWAFATTFCRDLPLDHVVFQDPLKFLTARMAAPAVRLDSAPVVTRHIHAALLAAFLRTHFSGLDIKTSAGAFFGATDDGSASITENSADSFLIRLRDSAFAQAQSRDLYRLVLGTALARRGFTPSYGFPVDVVRFDHLSGRRRDSAGEGPIAFGEYQGGASRTLDVAIREYAPGAEVVIDGLVHQSEGIQPAWAAMADTSGLEDLQFFWECKSCRGFGVSRIVPETCPHCGLPKPHWHKALRPAGFLGRREPHTGYESLGQVPFEMPKISAANSSWQALPDPSAGRLRADHRGHVITQSSGPHGKGYALCLCCGRAMAETDDPVGPIPETLKNHKPLAPLPPEQLVRGYCPGGLTRTERIQRNLRFIQETRTDVFELQLPSRAKPEQGLALAAALREALASRLGAEAREVGLAVGQSSGTAQQSCISAFLYDRAAGGAGLATRLIDFDWIKDCLAQATRLLDCPENCDHGCPACIMRPDLNFVDAFPDRPGGLALAEGMYRRLDLPPALQAFGAETRFVGMPLIEWLERRLLAGSLRTVTVYLHGAPGKWELAAWPIAELLERLTKAGVNVTFVLASAALTDKGLEMAQKLDLHRLAARAELAHALSLPSIRNVPLLAVAEVGTNSVGFAATDPAEAMPGPNWGLGQHKPLVCGAAGTMLAFQTIAADQLVKLSTGNAQLIWLNHDLDGPAAGFGTRFWKALSAVDPLTVAALKRHGVTKAVYCDRYLLTPLNLRLLHEVISALPGKASGLTVEVETALCDRPGQVGWAPFHPFGDDALRRAILQQLFPRAKITISPKTQRPHARSLSLHLSDGRRLQILLDQGFGAWRLEGASPRYDFSCTAEKQARDIKNTPMRLRIAEMRGAPAILEFQ